MGLEGVKGMDVNVQALVSVQDATKESISGDLGIVGAGYLCLMVYVLTFMGEFHAVKSRVGLGCAGLLSVGLAIGSTFGLASALGLFYGPVHQVLPLLLLGVGIDDAFVLVTSMDATDSRLALRERVARAVSRGGTAITVTSVTNSAAFFIGSLTSLPALKHFAVWAGIGILFDFLYQVTFFVAFMTMDTHRQDENRRDVVVCCKVKAPKTKNVFGLPFNSLQRFFEYKFAPFILRRVIMIPCLLLALGGFITCLYGMTQIEQAFQPSYFYLDGSYAKDFINTRDEYFPEQYLRVGIFTTEPSMDYTSADTQRKLLAMFDDQANGGLIQNSEWVENGTLSSWFIAFRAYANVSGENEVIPSENYYGLLSAFLGSSQGSIFVKDLVFNQDSSLLVASRSSVAMKDFESNEDEIAGMKSIRASVDEADLPGAFPYAYEFIFFEQYDVLPQEAVTNILASLIVVLVVAFILIGNPKAAIFTFLGVAFSVVDIIGICHYWDINLNSVVVVNLALAVGLSIDYSAHICLAFMESSASSRHGRVIMSLRNLGPPLLHGGISTFLAIVVLIFAKSYIFRVFFKMFFMIIGFGMFHGMVIIPQLLYLAGPRGFYASEEEAVEDDRRIFVHAPDAEISGDSVLMDHVEDQHTTPTGAVEHVPLHDIEKQ